MVAPAFRLCIAAVTSPTLRTHSSKWPLLRLGDELMEIGASPIPEQADLDELPGFVAERLADGQLHLE